MRAELIQSHLLISLTYPWIPKIRSDLLFMLLSCVFSDVFCRFLDCDLSISHPAKKGYYFGTNGRKSGANTFNGAIFGVNGTDLTSI